MRKTSLVLAFLFAFVFLAFATTNMSGQETKKETAKVKVAKAPNAMKMGGTIIRQNETKSTMDVKGKTTERVVVYNEMTKWMMNDKPADKKEFKDGKRIVVHGILDEKGQLLADKIVLRP